jgi:predicted nuclease of predicted toxin-antitoxin system
VAKVKFFLDEHIPKAVAKGLRARGVEVLTCAEADRLAFSDAEHLQFAFSEGFVVVTADNDFLTLHSDGVSHAGIAFAARPLTIGQFINALMLIHEVLEAGEMLDHIESL